MPSSYAEQVAITFLFSDSAKFGQAGLTVAESDALKQRLKYNQSDEAKTRQSIIEYGYPVPGEVTAEMVALSGAAHACGTTIDLAERSGPEGARPTYESYTTKNQFDRFTLSHLPKALHNAWKQPIEREAGFVNDRVVYPVGANLDMIHGAAKPHRLLPAQTFQQLESARLGKLDDLTKRDWSITDNSDIRRFGVEWDILAPIVWSTTGLVQLSGDIGSAVAGQLLENGLSQQQVAAVLRTGYNTSGIQLEHGNLPQSAAVSQALLKSLEASPLTHPLVTLLD